MPVAAKNSLDLLRLIAATLVLYSHQHVLLGHTDPSFLGWTTFGGAGVSIFFFLSGFLVWSSWVRDANLRRFFQRRSLRIFPALVLLVLATVFCFGPALTRLSLTDYFDSSETWRYLSTAALLVRRGLPGVFDSNPYPQAVNGSLWTLPVEFLCYVSVALIGSIRVIPTEWRTGTGLALALLAAALGSRLLGERFVAHFEMVAFFWWGVLYAWLGTRPALGRPQSQWLYVAIALGLVLFVATSPRGAERTSMLLCAAALVMLARRYSFGAPLTDRLGDLSYGMYIFAFPVQQLMVVIGRGSGWSFEAYFTISLLVTSTLAYASWHLIEKRALRFKPKSGAVAVVPA